MTQQIPKLFFVGAGNIAQSIIKGIIRSSPHAAEQILATAPTRKNLSVVQDTLGCHTTLLENAISSLNEFDPDYVFLCVKPQVLMTSISQSHSDKLASLLKSVPDKCTTLSLLAGIKSEIFSEAFALPRKNVVRVMLNTAAEIGSSSVIYYTQPEFSDEKVIEMEAMFKLLGQAIVRLNDEQLMNVATGVCGSGIAFFYEIIQTISDNAVKNGFSRCDATIIAAQLSKSAGEMLLHKKSHPYQLRDDVTSPAGTTIYGLSNWHENSTSLMIGRAFQAAIDRAKKLSEIAMSQLQLIHDRYRKD